ncbi:MAG: hypothetical protein CMJ49_02170 [Planctomycetaceae bacterium]|nr:hypothetical protein [Planctomycetaceae bacterium]
MGTTSDQLQPGTRVRITHQIPQRDEVWTTSVTGTVEKVEQTKTGSWYAHAKHDKLWLDRLHIRADDGELIILHLDPYTRVDVIDEVATGD